MKLWEILKDTMIAKSQYSSKRYTGYWLMWLFTAMCISEPIIVATGVNYHFPTEVSIAILSAIVALHGVGSWEASKTKTEQNKVN